MFKFLKNKINKVVDNFSKKVEEPISPEPEKPTDSFSQAIEEIRKDLLTKEKEITSKDSDKGLIKTVSDRVSSSEGKSVLSRIGSVLSTTEISPQKFDDLFEEMEMSLLENNVAMEVIDKIKSNLKTILVNKPIPRGKISQLIKANLTSTIEELFQVQTFSFTEKIRSKKPFVILFAGINGSGKTTTIAKVAHLIQKQNLKCVLAASDTFRAAAIHQLEEHASRIGVKVIKHDYGSDPAAVSFDAIKYAQAKDIDVVLIDTAGRLHSNSNLMAEMKKLVRIAKPDLKIFVGEAITGNDCTDQAKAFDEAIGIDGIILSKADVDERGGTIVSVSYVTHKPILYLGTGQSYDDLTPFDSSSIINSLGLVE